MPPPQTLLSDSDASDSDSGGGDAPELRINDAYAKRFQARANPRAARHVAAQAR